MTAHGEVVRSYEPEEMEPTKKQRFCALVHGSARLDDHAIIGDVTHERTVQRRVHGLGRARNVDGYIHEHSAIAPGGGCTIQVTAPLPPLGATLRAGGG